MNSELQNFNFDRLKHRRRMIKPLFGDNGHSTFQGLQKIHTPYDLCQEIILKLSQCMEKDEKLLKESKIATLNLEFIEVLTNTFGISTDNIVFVSDLKEKTWWAKKYGVEVIEKDFLEWETDMKFDVVIGNPPYQVKDDKNYKKTQPIWHKFVEKSINLTKENGYTCLIHPSGWRGPGMAFKIAKCILDKQIHYLEIHDEQDGLKTFGAITRYDWYVRKNTTATYNTEIKDQHGRIFNINLYGADFIPNSQVDRILSMLAKPGEDSVEVLHSFSDYESRKPWMSKIQHDDFIYPIVYSTPVQGPTIWYSNTNQNGHFGVSKLILNPCRPIGFFIDEKGEYGMSQFCVGIVGDVAYLNMVADVIKNQKTNGFAEFMEACHFTDKIFNKDVFSLFRKDFWKEFVNEDGTEKE